jgi:hypothetical protein
MRRLLVALGLPLVLVAVAACSATDTTADALPDGVTVSAYQTRSDAALRRVELSVSNDSPEPLHVTGLSLRSDQFERPAVWAKKGTTIAAGTTVDLPVTLSAPDCDAEAGALAAAIEFETDGRTARVTVPVPDDDGLLARLAAADCLAERVAEHAEIAAATLPRTTMIGDRLVAQLDLTVKPTGEPGMVRIDEVRGTTLLRPADPVTGLPVEAQPIARTIDEDSAASGSQPIVITLLLVPNRCDAHAVAEDKRGTILPLHVALDGGVEGVLSVAATDDVKNALIRYVQTACGTP